ncbi:MAG: diaminopimelate epimerase [Thermodesulfobacteriota bacterium]
MPFTKMHGIGNDYVYVDAFAHRVEDPARVARLVSPRRTGIGSDGLILIRPSDVADCRMEMYNADGSRGEMCGNGIRCVAKYAYEHGIARKPELSIETDAGVKTLALEARDGRVESVTVDMGEPILDGAAIPVRAEGRVVDAPFEVDGETERITCVSMGNPHCVLFVGDTASAPVTTLGPRIETDPFFPKRVNVEFVELLGPAPSPRLRMRVWERGSGETAACGTGACAVAVAAHLTGRAPRRVEIELLGGSLGIEWRESDGHVYMTGPATEVFSGEVEV